jgi:hypothetical protein
MPFKRSSTLSLLIFAAIVFAGYRIFQLWQEPLMAPPASPKKHAGTGPGIESQPRLKPFSLSIASIVNKTLFDPKRGSGPGKVTETSSVNRKPAQDFVLLGTMITPGVRQAIIRVPRSFTDGSQGSKGPGVIGGKRGANQLRRVDLGDSLGGFELAEVEPGKGILLKGSDRIELVLDFTRKTNETMISPQSALKAQPPTQPRKRQARTPRRRKNRG